MLQRATAAIALGGLVGAPVFAQTDASSDPTGPTSSPDRLLENWRAEYGSSWRTLQNPRTGTLEMLYGGNARSPFEPSVSDPEQWVIAARHWVAETYAMHGLEDEQLDTPRFSYLPLGQGNTTDKVTVRLEQSVGGVPVEDGAVNVLFDASGRLLSLHATGAPEVEDPTGQPTIDGGFATLVAARAFRDEFDVAPTSSANTRLVHAHIDDGEVRRWPLVWQVEVTWEMDGAQPIGRRYSVDAHGRTVLKSENTIHNFDVFGTVRSNASPGTEADHSGNPPTPLAMPRVRIQSSAGNVETDRDGNFNITGVNSPIDLTVDFFGRFTNVNNDAGPDYTITFQNVQPNVQNNLLMNPSPTQFITAEANAQLHVNVLRDWIVDRFPTDNTADFRATANINQNSNCNAFFNGNSINHFTRGGGCNNTSFSTVVAHEMGHWLNVRYGTGNGSDGMGEGNADVFAMYCYDDPVVGRFFSTNGGIVRTGTNLRQFCGDTNPGCYGGVHANGEVWMGAAWKLRENLNVTLGNAGGDLVADLLFLGWLNGFNQTQIRSIIEIQWLTLDDDDGNIDNGTPNYLDIDAGFRTQGFPGFDLDLITIENVTELADTTDQTGPYVVDANIFPNFGSTIVAAELNYRSGTTGAFTVVPMTNLGGTLYRGDIPGQTSPARVEYFVSATDLDGQTETFPLEGQDDPVIFRIGVTREIFATDFESGPAGFVGGEPGDTATTGIWELGDPIGTAAQPENDNTNPGVNCWFTGQGTPGGGLGENDIDNGRTTLLSPIFDGTGGLLELDYWRWYSNDTGGEPNTERFRVELSNDGGATYAEVESVGPAGEGTSGGWFRSIVDLSSVPTSAQMRLRFIAADRPNNGGAVVEAAVDDIRIISLESTVNAPQRYCISNPNSTGTAATIDVAGSQQISANDFLLQSQGLPPNSFGLFFFGDAQTQAPIVNSQGTICVAGTLFRLPAVQAALFGTAFYPVDFTDATTNAVQITAGSTWNFQMWFRDAIGGQVTSNTTDGIQVEFAN
ncbi:MAG: hypothetical protein AAF726_15870 [Planctomycetota bacterium]